MKKTKKVLELQKMNVVELNTYLLNKINGGIGSNDDTDATTQTTDDLTTIFCKVTDGGDTL